MKQFLSTPSARRATELCGKIASKLEISIHALREEGDTGCAAHKQMMEISIHALREEGDCWSGTVTRQERVISIHALREEGDEMSDEEKALQNDFYPRPPRGGRPWAKRVLTIWGIFLSTPSARRATHPCRQSSCWQ